MVIKVRQLKRFPKQISYRNIIKITAPIENIDNEKW